ncbi:ABC transporter permease [Variovorax sp. PCZ-1]|uniref:ABC transporter permease n=1 Tax=Variovorax sp. PCZ-1 TaxID=2835533 RepID=UPI001BD0D555|nr:ABC transporter permease [Variovorax sp. PCZ-1]MBS7808164.1 ABC transporter permease [Variovorax sp. PCZ-1]
MLELLRSFSWQELRQHPWRYAAALASIALGVALAFSVHLINASALSEFSSALQSVQGQPDASVRGAGNFDETALEKIAAQESVELASPALELSTYAIDMQGKKRSVRVIGVDALSVASISPALMPRPKEASERFAVFAPRQAFLNAAALQAFGSNELRVVNGNRIETLDVAGSIGAPGAPIIVMDLGAMQDAFGLNGQLSTIDLRLRPGATLAALQLPEGLLLTKPSDANERSDQLSRAYRVNMTVLALVALFTGAFLVYSVHTLAIAKRGQQLALLGVLGLTARQRLQLVLIEASLLGFVGAALGIALGAGLAALGLKALGGDLGGGYFSRATPPLQWSWIAALIYAALGWLAALAGAWWPARAAQSLPLAQTLKGLGTAHTKQRKPWLALFLIALGAILSWAPPLFGMPIAAYLAVGMLLVGGMGLLPWAVSLLYDRLSPYVASHALALLAVERARRMREVAVVAVSGVVAALSLGVALTVMVSSFRVSVSTWLDTMLPAPLYARLTSSTQTAQGLYFPPEMLQRLSALPEVERVQGLRLRNLNVGTALPDVQLIARPLSLQDAAKELPLVGEVFPPPVANAIPLFVSEAMLQLHQAAPGQIYDQKWLVAGIDTAQSATESIANTQVSTFYVAGVWRDYVRQFGSVVMDQAQYQQLSGDARINDLAIWPKAGSDETALQAKIRQIYSQDAQLANLVEFASSAEIRSISLKMFDRSFAVTYWLQAVAIAIGLFGIATSFSAQVLSRRKEFGLLAHLGLTRSQILRVVALEGAAWTAIGAIAGCVLGLLVSLVLIHVVNPQSFRWTMDMSIPWSRLVTLGAAVMLAGTITAWLAGRAAASREAVLAVKEDW